jgi:hypothetical protein
LIEKEGTDALLDPWTWLGFMMIVVSFVYQVEKVRRTVIDKSERIQSSADDLERTVNGLERDIEVLRKEVVTLRTDIHAVWVEVRKITSRLSV